MRPMDRRTAPLAKKLKLKPGLRAAVDRRAAGYLERLGIVRRAATWHDARRPLDWVQVFVRTSAELAGDRRDR